MAKNAVLATRDGRNDGSNRAHRCLNARGDMMKEPRLDRAAWRLRAVVVVCAGVAAAASVEARVTRIVIDSTTAVAGGAIPYQTLRGRAFGELDPNDDHNAVITDIQLGKDADGKVRYETTFTITKPVDLSMASGFLWH